MWAFPMAMDRTGAGGALVKMDGVCPGGGTLFRAKMSVGEYSHIALVHDTDDSLVGPTPCNEGCHGVEIHEPPK